MSFIQNIWYPALNSYEVEPAKPRALTLIDKKIVVYRKSDGGIVALEDRCSHRFAPLSIGRVIGDDIMCMYHGLKFCPAGDCVDMPGQAVATGFGIRAYPVVERASVIWIWAGEAAKADPALIPDNPLADADVNFSQGVLDFDCEYELINDNLTDFSHVSYVHESTVGRFLDEWAQRHPEVTSIDNGVRISRWIVNEPQLPLPGHPPKVDLWQAYDYLVPGVMRMWMDYYPVGAAERFAHGAPDPTVEKPLYTSYFFQTATPVSKGKTRFLWGIAVPKAFGDVSHQMTVAIVKEAFIEDQTMIEAQQRGIDDHPGLALRNTAHDGALVRVRRLIQQRLRAEQGQDGASVAAE